MRAIKFLIIVTLCSGCATIEQSIPGEVFFEEAKIASETKTSRLLKSLPAAQQKITLSVYDFNDYTGQHKSSDVTEYSRAITQGGVHILKKALVDAGNHSWYRVLERGGLENLLQERKIIRSVRDTYATPKGQKLGPVGPLLYSGVLLEGGIVSYESNIFSGGAGARYLGIGANTEYRKDLVTVYLRATNVTTGEVVIAVNTSKTIFSLSLQSGVFKFVSFDKLLESEAGLVRNEPPQFAVRQAIEMAVYAMIMEGSLKGLWEFKDPVSGEAAVRDYLKRSGQEDRKINIVTSSKKPAKKALSKNRVQNKTAKNTLQNNFAQERSLTPRKRLKSNFPPAKRYNDSSYREGDRAAEPRSKVPEGWYVQVLAYHKNDYFKGRNVTEEISQLGYPVMTQAVLVDSVPYLRVLIGPYSSRQLAKNTWKGLPKYFMEHEHPFVRFLR